MKTLFPHSSWPGNRLSARLILSSQLSRPVTSNYSYREENKVFLIILPNAVIDESAMMIHPLNASPTNSRMEDDRWESAVSLNANENLARRIEAESEPFACCVRMLEGSQSHSAKGNQRLRSADES